MGDHPVREALQAAWKQVRADYDVGRVNSERTLQACLFRRLHDKLPGCTIFCEPHVRTEKLGLAVPDLLVVAEAQVVVVIELKFVPHAYPVFEEDIAKLAAFGSHQGEFPIIIDPGTGKFKKPSFSFAPDCLLVFAVIGHHDAKAVDADFLRSQIFDEGTRSRFLPLTHAVKDQ